MKFGTYFAYWEQEWSADYIQYCSRVSNLGFDILEIAASALPDMNRYQLAELRDTARNNNVSLTSCIGMPSHLDVASEDESTRRKGIDFLKRILENMDMIDSRILGGIIYAYWPCDFNKPFNKPKAWENSLKSIRELAVTATDYGITLTVEVVNRFEQFLINDAKEAVDFVRQTGSNAVKIMLDSFHMNIEEDNIGDSIRYAGPYLGHFHIGENNRKVPGKGHMPWAEIGQALRDINYNAGVVMEPFVRVGGTVGDDIKVFRDLSDGADDKGLDDDIRQSLIFVKNQFLGE
jgi:D-psicose/D-tagatose/L-ribulose 3-epimerase